MDGFDFGFSNCFYKKKSGVRIAGRGKENGTSGSEKGKAGKKASNEQSTEIGKGLRYSLKKVTYFHNL